MFDFAKSKFHVGKSTLGGILTRFAEHFRGHIDTDAPAASAYGLGRQETIKPGAAA
jgi:hypothetical protein